MEKLIPILYIALAACEPQAAPTAQEARRAEAQRKEENRRRADTVADEIIYVRTKSGFCFAYLWERDGNGESAVGGPALATIDCDKAAPFLANGPVPAEAPAQTTTAP